MNQFPQNMASVIVQLVLAIIMLAVAFEVTLKDLKALPAQWKKIIVGYLMQITFLPVYMVGLMMIIDPPPNVVLAFLLLAACPGGNLSQLFVMRSQGNIGLSMGLTFFSTLLSPLTVPLIFYLCTHSNLSWQETYKTLSLPWGDIFQTLFLSLFTPLMIGMWLGQRKSKFLIAFKKVIQKLVPILLVTLLGGAAWSFRASLHHLSYGMFLMVLGISMSCFMTTYFLSRFFGYDYETSVTYGWEVSIQNSGLGMVLGIIYFPSIPEVSLVGALWGIWQMFMGVVVSGFIRKIISRNEVLCQTTDAG
jgi:bile acid:Na+ symporter, BASS family